MRFIRTTNNIAEFIETSDKTGKIISSMGFQFGEVYYQIKNGKVTFYLNDQENPFRNDIWTLNIPFVMDGVEYADEDSASAHLYAVFNDRFQEQLDQLKEDLAAESARAQEAEEQLDDKIEEETARAINQENRLQDEITELSGTVATFDGRITNVENGLSSLTETVNDEITRSTAKDAEHDAQISGLTNTLNSEIQRALSAETQLHNEILAEEGRAFAAESAITANLNNEISRSTEKDTQHDTQISALTVSLDNEIQRATEAENSLRTDLNAEIANRISGDTNLQNQLDAEIARAQDAEEDLDDKIDGEIARANSEETRIEGKLDNEITRSTAKDVEHDTLISGLTDDLASEVARATARENQIDTKLDNEIARATNAEDALDTKIDNEIARSTAKDASHDSSISGLTTSLQSEINRATNVENSLRTDLNAEISRATNAENALDDKIDLEIQNRIDAVSGLTERVADDEASTGAALVDLNNKINALSGENASQNVQISGLTNSINTEISRATSVENSLRSDLNAEVSARTTSDNTQNQRLTTIENTLPTKADKVDAVASAEYVSANHIINFKNINGAVISSIDAAPFIKDGMVDNVAIVNGNLVITFNTDAGKQAISIPLTAIFDPANYYNKSEIDASQAAQDTKINTISGNVNTLSGEVSTISGEVSTISGDVTTIKNSLSGDYATKEFVSGYTYDKATIDDKIAQGGTFDPTNYYDKSATDALLSTKQNTLTAGSGISIQNNVISATGGSQPVDAYTKAESDARFQQKLTAGSGISISNNVISVTGGTSTDLPLEVGEGLNSLKLKNANTNKANAPYSFVGGDGCTASTDASESFVWGSGLQTKNLGEVAFGSFNVSSRDLDGQIEISSACTSFSIGGGSRATGRKNDFELRKNGDIYINYNREFVKLQDYLIDPETVYTKTESDNKYATIGNFNSHSGNTDIHVTASEKATWNAKADANNVYTKTDADAKYATITNFNSHSGNTDIHVTASEKAAWDAKSNFSGSYNDLTDKPTIPNYTAGDGIDITNNVISTVTKFWCGDEAAYNQIAIKDPNTIYLIHS